MIDDCLIESLQENVGRTVTIYTESGGMSGSGFTGVLACVTPTSVRLITDIGAPPACAIGSDCTYGPEYGYGGGYGGYGGGCCSGGGYGGFGGGYGAGFGGGIGRLFGSIVEIPICKIVGFVHHAI